jgi:protein ImuB
MRRVVSLFPPTWPTDRYRKNASDAPPRDKPLVTAMKVGPRRIVAASDKTALALGLRPGLTIAHAQALVPDLHIAEATPEEDNEGLARLATWCLRYSPLVAADRPDGVWIEVAGSAHLFGGEEALLNDLTRRLRRAGVSARAAVADTPRAAWAVARHGSEHIVVPGGMAAAIADLPAAALRLPGDTVDTLRRLGVERIGQVAAMPRAPLVRRFGGKVRRRLDQALGHAAEPFEALMPPEVIRRGSPSPNPSATGKTSRGWSCVCVAIFAPILIRSRWGRGGSTSCLAGSTAPRKPVQVKAARPNRDPTHPARF